MDHCINTVSPSSITLHENKRLKTQADKVILRQLKAEIFNESIPTGDTVKKYFKFATEIKTTSNIAYKNSTCEGVAYSVRKLLNKTVDYEVGEVLVCRKYFKTNGWKCSVNCEFVVKALKGDLVCIRDRTGQQTRTHELNRDLIKQHFIHSYCRTCHSFQGSSIEGKITIFDWRFFFVNRKWIYTAVTRATELKNVCFFAGPTTEFDETVLNKYLAKEVENYKNKTFNTTEL